MVLTPYSKDLMKFYSTYVPDSVLCVYGRQRSLFDNGL